MRIRKRLVNLEVRFIRLETRFDNLEVRLRGIEATLNDFIKVMQQSFFNLEKSIDARFDDMNIRFDALTNEVRGTQRRQGVLELQQEDTADTVMNHEERVVRLELATG